VRLLNNQYNIKWKKCKKCGYLQHNSHLRCLKCKNEIFEEIKPKGYAKLLTYTILKAVPMEFRDKDSYALGIVEFENGVKALGQITEKENLTIGMKLEPIYMKICDDLNGKEIESYKFKPLA